MFSDTYNCQCTYSSFFQLLSIVSPFYQPSPPSLTCLLSALRCLSFAKRRVVPVFLLFFPYACLSRRDLRGCGIAAGFETEKARQG